MSTDAAAYEKFKVKAPLLIKGNLSTVDGSGEMSCLWSIKALLEHGCKLRDLIPLRHSMKATNSAPIK